MTIEREWTTAAGYPAKVIMSDKGYRCGYVGVHETHALYGAWARLDFFGQKLTDRITVFNGLTYSGIAAWKKNEVAQ